MTDSHIYQYVVVVIERQQKTPLRTEPVVLSIVRRLPFDDENVENVVLFTSVIPYETLGNSLRMRHQL